MKLLDFKMEELIIVGGGPTGLSAAIYAGRAGLNPLVIEGSPAGGQLMLTSDVENYPGFAEAILGPELIAKFRRQAERFGSRFLSKNVVKLEIINNVAKLVINTNEFYEAKAVLIATGANAKWLNIPSEQRLRGKGVSACATCDGFFFKDKTIAVVGGGDTAMEEAFFLTRFAKKVYIIHRRGEFRASKIMQERVLNNSKIEVIWNATVVEVLGEDKVEGVKLKMIGHSGEDSMATTPESTEFSTSQNDKSKINEGEAIRNLALDGLFIAIGHKPATDFLQGSGVLLDKVGYVYTSGRVALENLQKERLEDTRPLLGKFDFRYQYMTAVSGVFAAGDCVDYTYRQAGTAAGMGIAAELEIEKWLQEKENK